MSGVVAVAFWGNWEGIALIEQEITEALDRIKNLETAVEWLTGEVGRLSERLAQATSAEDIIRRAGTTGE